jgi:integrase/recombinase XerC/integrase/recombinase XerD
MRNYSDRTIDSYEQVVKYLAYYVWLRRHADPEKLVFYWKDLDNARLDTDVDISPAMITDFFSFLSSLRTYKTENTPQDDLNTLVIFPVSLYPGGTGCKSNVWYRTPKSQRSGT